MHISTNFLLLQVTDFSGFQLVVVFPSSCTVNVQPTANLALLGLPNNIMIRAEFSKTLLCVVLYHLTPFLEKSFLFFFKNVFLRFLPQSKIWHFRVT